MKTLPCFCSEGTCAIHHSSFGGKWSTPEMHFVDPETGEVLDEGTDGSYIDHDVHGTPFAGDDEYHVWWGTDRAVWVLSFGEHYIVSGYIGGITYIGHFLGTEKEVTFYCATHGIKAIQTELV